MIVANWQPVGVLHQGSRLLGLEESLPIRLVRDSGNGPGCLAGPGRLHPGAGGGNVFQADIVFLIRIQADGGLVLQNGFIHPDQAMARNPLFRHDGHPVDVQQIGIVGGVVHLHANGGAEELRHIPGQLGHPPAARRHQKVDAAGLALPGHPGQQQVVLLPHLFPERSHVVNDHQHRRQLHAVGRHILHVCGAVEPLFPLLDHGLQQIEELAHLFGLVFKDDAPHLGCIRKGHGQPTAEIHNVHVEIFRRIAVDQGKQNGLHKGALAAGAGAINGMMAADGEIDFHGFLGLVGGVVGDAGEDGQLPFGAPGRPFAVPERALGPALHLGQYHLPGQRRQPQGLQFLAVLLPGHIRQVIDHCVQLGFPFHLRQLDAPLQSGVHQPAGPALCFHGGIAALQ